MLARKPLRLALVLLCAVISIPSVLVATPQAEAEVPAQTLALVSGRVLLQGRSAHAGITVRVGGASATTDATGAFIVSNPPVGAQRAEASKAGFLSAAREGVVITSSGSITLAEVTLPAGDVDGDQDIDLFDLVLMGAAFGQCPPADARLDPNADGCVNILDLVLLGANYNLRGPVVWEAAPAPTPTVPASPTPTLAATATLATTATPTRTPTLPISDGAEARLVPEFRSAQVGELFTLDVRITSPERPVDGAAIYIDFDPTCLMVVDSAGNPTDQITPDPSLGIVFTNQVDSALGQIDYVAGATLPPAPVPVGSFVVARIRFKALAATADTEVRFVVDAPRRTRTLCEGEATLQRHVNAMISISRP